MDGMVAAIRSSLDAAQFEHIPILSYAVKYASALLRPLPRCGRILPGLGTAVVPDGPGQCPQALREAGLDVAEGADMLMVKPALPYLDVIHRGGLHRASPLPTT